METSVTNCRVNSQFDYISFPKTDLKHKYNAFQFIEVQIKLILPGLGTKGENSHSLCNRFLLAFHTLNIFVTKYDYGKYSVVMILKEEGNFQK